MCEQAIIFQDGRAIGRSGRVQLFSCPSADASLCASADSLAVESFAVQLDAWLPSWKTKSEGSSPLYIAVDEAFKASTFRVQLIGRTRQGKTFALPFAYQFTGACVCSRLDYFDQYVRRHQENRRSTALTPLSCEHAINFGALKSAQVTVRLKISSCSTQLPQCQSLFSQNCPDLCMCYAILQSCVVNPMGWRKHSHHTGFHSPRVCPCAEAGLQSFTAVFDVVDQPHWLKCFVLRFSVLIAAKLDDSSGPGGGRTTAADDTSSSSSMAPAQRPGSAAAQHGAPQQVAKGTPPAAERAAQAAECGWLPPALLPPKADGGAAGGKQKQPKKRAKQRGSGGAGAGAGVQTIDTNSSSAGSGSWEISALQKRAGTSTSCMSDSSVEGDVGLERAGSQPDLHADAAGNPLARSRSGSLGKANGHVLAAGKSPAEQIRVDLRMSLIRQSANDGFAAFL